MCQDPPAIIAPYVTAFCQKISPGKRPVYLPITPESDCEASECFHNVRNKVEREGGRIQFGWAIWEWAHVFIEAQHHAVYDGSAGASWRDITPMVEGDPQCQCLFLPDDLAVYNFLAPEKRDNIREPLAQDPRILRYLQLAAERAQIIINAPGQGLVRLSGAANQRMQMIASETAILTRQIGLQYTPANARCFCGSGQKFKRCCQGKLLPSPSLCVFPP